MSLLRKFFGSNAITAPAPNAAQEPAAPRDDSEDRLAAALALAPGEARETTLVALAGSSRIPAVRLKAASALTSPGAWQTLLAASQDRDRRVWKMMKDRLAIVRRGERAGVERAAIEQGLGEILAKRPVDLARLVDLDKRWDAIKEFIEAGPLAALRSQVSARIEAEQLAQVELRRITQAAVAGTAGLRAPDADVEGSLIQAKALTEALAAVQADNAPPSQLTEAQGRVAAYSEAVAGAQAEHAQYGAALEQARAMLGQVEGIEAASLELCQNLEASWGTIKLGPGEQEQQIKERFLAGLAKLKEPHQLALEQARQKAQNNAANQKEHQERLRNLITQAEEALERGAAAIAIKLVDEMRVLRSHVGPLSPGWKSRLSAAEKQVAKLRGWQRYTGEKLREELIIAADKLKDSHLTPDLLAKEITLLQDAWKKLDTEQEAGAPKPLWERFHAATNLAYERVKAYREQQAKEREAHAEVRRALIAEAAPLSQMFSEPAPPGPEAWKALPGQRSSLHDRWSAAGPVNRNDMKELQAQFAAHMKALDAASNLARKTEKQRKNALIAEVDAALQAATAAVEAAAAAPAAAPAPSPENRPERGERGDRNGRASGRANERANERGNERGNSRGGDRGSERGRERRPDTAPPALIQAMRTAQEAQKRWQEERHPMPLPRKEEQQLWEAFRAKCSAIFALRDAQRDEERGKSAAQESTRQLVIDKVLAIGEAADAGVANSHLAALLTEWNAMERSDGPSRKRFDDAVARARNRIDSLKREAAAAVAGKLLAFDTALSNVEQAQAEGKTDIDTASLAAQQEELAKALARHKGLKARAERILKGNASGSAADWAKLVTAGGHSRAALLLDLEMTLGIDSPPELAQARRTRQLERLADAMKNRAPARTPDEMFEALLALPAAPSEQNVVRVAAIVAHMERPKR